MKLSENRPLAWAVLFVCVLVSIVLFGGLGLREDRQSVEEVFYTGVDDVTAVAEYLTEHGYELLSAQVEMVPQTYIKLTDEGDLKSMQKMLDMFEDNDDVQNVWHNWDQD